MKRHILIAVLISFLLLSVTSSCQSEESRKADKEKKDSLDRQATEAQDTENKKILDELNMSDDTSSVKETPSMKESDAPDKKD